MIDCIQSLLWPKLTVSEKLQHQLSVDENLHWQILGNGSRKEDENYALWRKDSQSTHCLGNISRLKDFLRKKRKWCLGSSLGKPSSATVPGCEVAGVLLVTQPLLPPAVSRNSQPGPRRHSLRPPPSPVSPFTGPAPPRVPAQPGSVGGRPAARDW